MHCEEAEGLLARLVYDELDELDAELGEGTAEKLRAHVESCDACRERAGDMRVAAKLLKDGVELETPVLSPERKERLERETARAETAASGAGGGRRRIAFWIVTASAAVLLVGFFLSTLFMTVGMAPKMMLMEGLSGDDEGHIFRGEPEPAGEEFASRTLYDSVSGAAGGGAAPGSDEGDATGVGDRIADTNETWGGTQALEFDDSGNWNVPQTVTVTGKRASGPAPTGYDGQARFDPFEDGGPGELRLPQTVQRTVVTKRPGGDLRPDGLDLGIVGRKTAGGKTADGSFTYTPSSGFAAEEAKTYAYSTGDAAKPPPRTVSAWHRGMWHHGTATPESLSRDHEISGRAYEPVAVAPAGGAVTSEAGGEARFDVWLNAQPTSRDLTVAVTNGLVTTEAGGGAEAPVVFSVTPAEGPTQGGTGVVVTGDSFEKGARVAFGRGDRPASSASTGEPYAWSPNTRDPFFGGATYAEGPAETPPPPPAKPAGRAVAVNGEVASGLVAQWKFDDDGDAPRDTAGSGAPGGRASGRMTVPDDETRVTGGLRRQRGEGEKDEGAASRLAMARTSADKDVRAFEPNVGWVDRWGPDFTDLYEAKPGAAPAPKEPAAGPGAASSSRPAKTPQAAGAAVDLKSGGAVRGRLAYEWRNGGAVEVTTPEGATVRVPASEIAGVKRPSRKVRIPDQIDHPVIVHEEPEEFDHMQTENNMDADTARGQEDAISDIPLAGTGVAGGPGVGGGGSGAPARPKPDRRHRIILDQQRAIEVAKEKAQAAVAERKRYENRLNERAKPAKRKPPTSRPARARGRLNVNRGDGLAKQLDELAPPDEGARKAAPEAAKAEAKELIARAQSMMQARDGRGLESAERMLESALRKYSGTAAGKESEKRIAEARKRVAELRRKRAEDARRGAARDAKLAEGRDTYKRAAAAAFAEGGGAPAGVKARAAGDARRSEEDLKRRYANLKKALKKSKTSDLEVAALRGSAEDFDPRYRAKIESMIKREKEAQAKAERAAERRAGTKPAGSRGRRTRGEAERRLDELAGSAAAGEPDAAKAYSEAAEKAYEGLDYARALQLSERALEADPNDPKAKKLAEETRALLGVSREWAKEGLAKLRDEKKIVIQESLIALQQAVEKGKELQASAGEAGPGGAEAPEHEVLARKARDLDESVAQYRKSLEIMKWMPYQVDLSAKEKEVRASLAEAERARSKALAELRQEKKSASLGRVTGAALEELKMEPRTLGDLGEEAKKLIANGDFAGAERLAKSALKLDPGNKDLGALAQDARQKRHEKRLLDEQLAEAGVPYSGYLVYAEDWKEVARREGGEGRSIEHEVLREKVRQLTTMAQIEYERGNYERAEELSKRVLDRDRTNKDAKALVHQSRQKRHEEREEEQWAGWTWDPAPLAVEEAAIPYSERLRHPKDRKSGRRGRRGKPASEPDYWARSTAYTNETLPSGWRLAQAGTAGGAEAAKPEGEWTARGQEDAISDIPLGGTGVVGNLGVGGGGAGCFGFRSGGGRRRAALSGGGSAASENSVDRSLEWLWRHQRSDGSWSVRDFGGTIGEDADVGLTGLALLSFLGGGHTEKSGTPKYQAAVRKAVAYLRANQKPDGSIGENSGKAQSGSGYNHAIAGLALAEAFGMARVAETGAAAQKAVDYSVNIHQEPYSGWRYRPKERADMSVTGWFVMQLKSAIISGLRVDGKGFQGATAFLDKCTKRGGGHEGLVSYRPERSYTPTMTAIGLFCRQLMGGKRSQPALYGAANYLSSNLPDRNAPNHYYWYHGTNAMYQMGGAWWKMWNASVRDMLIEKQRRGPPKIDGSWDAEGPWTKQGGRALSTALGALILEAYYRYLPLYQGSGMQPEPAAGRDAKAGGPGTRARADAEAGVPSESPLWQAALELLGVAKEEERAPGAVPAKLLEAAARGEAAGEPEPFVKLAPGEAAALEAAKAAKAAEEAKAAAESAMIEKEPEPEPEPKPEPEEEEAPEAPEKAIEDLPPPPVNPFVLTARDRFSTFALDTDTASYTIARRHISAGRLPPRRSVRMEEWVNAFDYNYPRQARDVFNIFTEGTPAPFGKGLYLLKIGVQAKVIGREGRKPAHLVFVVDTSGSMERPDRLALVKHALGMLVSQLSPRDRVSLVSYGTKARIAFEAVPATEARRIVGDVFSLQIGGSTNMFEGLVLGYEIAKRQFRAGEVNRVILCSDGVANVGPTEAGEILEKVKRFRDWGVALTTAGFGAGSYNDEMLERLANSGDGNYVFIDSPREARRVFVEEMSATLQTVAKDAKIQVEFDPRRVRRYRLIGYENRDIADKDFRNDAVDAGEVGSGKSATALYEIELLSGPSAGFAGSRPAAPPRPRGRGVAPAELGTVFVRYRNLDTGKVEEISKRLGGALLSAETPESAPRLFLAACAAEAAEVVRGSEHARDGTLAAVEAILARVAKRLPIDRQVAELLALVRRAKSLRGER